MIYAFGEFELDTRVYELRRRGSARPVEPQVFDVLAYLVTNRDRLVTKDELLERLWPGRFVSETTLTSRLKAARKAVGDDGKAQLVIRTQHGRGYRFVAPVEEREGPVAAALAGASGELVVRPSPEERAAPPAAESPLAGRSAELAALERALARAGAGRRQLVFVAAEAGGGKTTLIDTFLRTAGAAVRCARGQCVERRGTGEPYMPLLDALGRMCRDPALAAAAAGVLEREAPAWVAQMSWFFPQRDQAGLHAQAGGERMLRELAMAVETLSRDVPLILVIEDLHWSDYATLEALDMLARQPHPARLLVIGTFRPSELRAARHPVYAVSQELRARGLCEILPLPPLALADVERVLAERFGAGAWLRDVAPVVHARTGGNPLFVQNLLESWSARSFLRRSPSGAWAPAVPVAELETDVPDSLQQLVENQIADLDPDQQRLLEAAAVIGRQFPAALLAATLPADEEAAESVCETLARAGHFLRSAGHDVWTDGAVTSLFAFAHDLYVDVFYDRVPAARRRKLHQQTGLALERGWAGREHEHGAELASHFVRSGDWPRAARYLDLAAEQAIGRSAYREAVLHLEKVLDVLPQLAAGPDRDRLELRARARLAPALIATRGWADPAAEEQYQAGIALARGLDDLPALSQFLYGAAIMYEYRGEYRRAEAIVRERIALDGEGGDAKAIQSHELLACSLMHQARYREAVDHGERAVRAADTADPLDSGTAAVLVQAHGWVSGALLFIGASDQALEHSRRAIEVATARGDDLARASALVQGGFLRFYRREADLCWNLVDEAAVIARERRFPFHLACCRILAGWVLSRQGHHDEALREVRGGLRTSRAIGARLDVPLFLAILIECLARAGQSDAAVEAMDEAFALVDRNRSFFYLSEIYRLSAELLASRGETEPAASALEQALALAAEQDAPLFGIRAAATFARTFPSARAAGELRRWSARFDDACALEDVVEARRVLSGGLHL